MAQADRASRRQRPVRRGRNRDRQLWPHLPRRLRTREDARGTGDAPRLRERRPGDLRSAFQPLWPEEMRASYFKLLEEQGQLREFTGKARTALASNPTDLDATARLFHYFRAQNNIPAARRVLLEYRIAKESGRAGVDARRVADAGAIVRVAARCERGRAPVLRALQRSAGRRAAHRAGVVRPGQSAAHRAGSADPVRVGRSFVL